MNHVFEILVYTTRGGRKAVRIRWRDKESREVRWSAEDYASVFDLVTNILDYVDESLE